MNCKTHPYFKDVRGRRKKNVLFQNWQNSWIFFSNMSNLIKTSHLLLMKPDKREILKTRSSKRDLFCSILGGLTFYFEIYGLTHRDPVYHSLSFFQGQVLHDCSTTSQTGNRHWCNPAVLLGFYQFLCACLCVWVFSSLPLVICGFAQPSHQSRDRIAPPWQSHATLSQPWPSLSLTNTLLCYF